MLPAHPIAVENPRGSVRKWTDADGSTGETLMLHDYGFIEGHVGNDGEELDCYVGPYEDAAHVYIVHQRKAPDFEKYDEDKLMLGWRDPESARKAYLAHRNDGERALGEMSSVPLDPFKAKLKRRTGTGKIRAGAALEDCTFAAIMALADRSTQMRAARPGAKKRDYPEVLTRRAATLAARALAPDLAGSRADIESATSFEQLKDAIVKRYRNKMDPTELARLIQRTRLMSNLAGRLAIVREKRAMELDDDSA